jgi:hypothetical protein
MCVLDYLAPFTLKDEKTKTSDTNLEDQNVVVVDLVFKDVGPSFGDRFAICDRETPDFPLSPRVDYSYYAELQFSQVDDYFGVRALSEEGDDENKRSAAACSTCRCRPLFELKIRPESPS